MHWSWSSPLNLKGMIQSGPVSLGPILDLHFKLRALVEEHSASNNYNREVKLCQKSVRLPTSLVLAEGIILTN